MTTRRSARLAWSLFAILMALVLGAVGLVAFGPGLADDALAVLIIGYGLVGTLIVTRRPGNTFGWILLAVGLSFAFTTFVDSYVRAESAPALVAVAWVSNWAWYVWLTVAAVFVPLLYPNGKPPSPRWRPVLWLGYAALTLSVLGAAFAPGALDVDSGRPIENPLGVGGAEGALNALSTAGNVAATIAFLLAASSLVVRFRRSRGTERQQLKWFASAGLLTLAGLAMAMLQVLFGLEEGDDPPTAGWLEAVGAVGWFTALFGIVLGIPIATGIAILRHRLYDIDVVIRRTLIYAALTGTLVACYLGGVLLLQLVLSPLTEDNDLAIAGSTLVAAAFFRPARARIQALVDRRFYRRRYDAQQTLEGFGSRLRDQVELDALSGELRRVVAETMQPAHVSLWLRHSA